MRDQREELKDDSHEHHLSDNEASWFSETKQEAGNTKQELGETSSTGEGKEEAKNNIPAENGAFGTLGSIFGGSSGGGLGGEDSGLSMQQHGLGGGDGFGIGAFGGGELGADATRTFSAFGFGNSRAESPPQFRNIGNDSFNNLVRVGHGTAGAAAPKSSSRISTRRRRRSGANGANGASCSSLEASSSALTRSPSTSAPKLSPPTLSENGEESIRTTDGLFAATDSKQNGGESSSGDGGRALESSFPSSNSHNTFDDGGGDGTREHSAATTHTSTSAFNGGFGFGGSRTNDSSIGEMSISTGNSTYHPRFSDGSPPPLRQDDTEYPLSRCLESRSALGREEEEGNGVIRPIELLPGVEGERIDLVTYRKDGIPLRFSTLENKPLGMLMKAYYNMVLTGPVRFVYNGILLYRDNTAKQLSMRSNDEIEILPLERVEEYLVKHAKERYPERSYFHVLGYNNNNTLRRQQEERSTSSVPGDENENDIKSSTTENLKEASVAAPTATTTTLKGEPASLNDEKGEDGKTTGNKSMMQQGHSSHFDSAIKLLECRLAETRKVNLKNKANVAISQSKLADMLMARGRIEEEGGGGGGGGRTPDLDKAIELYVSSLVLIKEMYLSTDVKYHPEVAKIENKLATAHETRGGPGDVEIAMELYESSFAAKKMIYMANEEKKKEEEEEDDDDNAEKVDDDGDGRTVVTCATTEHGMPAATGEAASAAAATSLSSESGLSSSLIPLSSQRGTTLSSSSICQTEQQQQLENTEDLKALRYMIRRILNLQEEVAHYRQHSSYSSPPFSSPFSCFRGGEEGQQRHQAAAEEEGGEKVEQDDEEEEESDVVGTFRYPFKTCTFEDTKSFHRHRTWIAHTIGKMEMYVKADKSFEELRLEDRIRLKNTEDVIHKHLPKVPMLKSEIMNAIFPGFGPKSIM